MRRLGWILGGISAVGLIVAGLLPQRRRSAESGLTARMDRIEDRVDAHARAVNDLRADVSSLQVDVGLALERAKQLRPRDDDRG